jgi:phage terminase large subunit-like protein
MPWQRLVADVGGELVETDHGWVPAYREVVVTVPRQSGKTTLILCWEVQRALGWDHVGPQRIAYSAQTGNDARKKLIEDQIPILDQHKAKLGIVTMHKGMGNESVQFVNRSRLGLLASTEDSGHGKTLHLGIKDELFADRDDRRDQALVPAMATVASAQMLAASTMGTVESVAWNATVERGREAVDRGLRSDTAYFEWSAESDSDPDDPAVWWGCMPALGHTISEPVVRHARRTLKLAEFRRAFMNITDDRRGDPLIPAELWEARCDPASQALDPVCFAADTYGAWSAIGAAGRRTDGRNHVVVVAHAKGTSWVPARMAELVAKWRPRSVVLDPAGEAGSLANDIEAAGVTIQRVTAREHSAGCVGFVNDVKEDRLRHLGQPSLEAAVDGADRRQVGDSWLWSRRGSSVDITPLVAVTLARWAHTTPIDPDPKPKIHVYRGES